MKQKVHVEILDPNESFNINTIGEKLVITESTGAITLYLGIVKKNKEGKITHGLFFKKTPESLSRLEKCVKSAIEKIKVDSVYVAHYTGLRKPGDLIMVIAASSEKREDSIEAIRAIVDSIKASEPLYKRELF